MYRLLQCFSILLLLTLFVGAQQKPTVTRAPKSSPATATVLPSEETVNAFLHEMFGYDSSTSTKIVSIKPSQAEGLAEVTVLLTGAQGSQATTLYVSPDGKHALLGEILPFGAHPFGAAQKELEKGVNGPSHGSATAPVTVVEFSDLQCPHCKEAQPTIDKLMSENKSVRVIFQNFPLPMHDWAAKAAAYGDCVGRSSSDQFWKFAQGVYAAQSDITAANADEKLTAIATGAGAKGAEIAACAVKPETTGRVEHSVALGKAVDVNSTPTLFINGRKIGNVGGLPYDVLLKLVDFAAKPEN